MACRSMVHLNSNLLCAIDTETTGDKVGFHDLIQICVLPLDSELKPNLKLCVPFYTEMKPRRPENCIPEVLEKNRALVCHAQIHGLDPDMAADLFDEWYGKLGLRDNKRIAPLAQNWPFDRQFLIDWLGHESFNRYFDARYRDTMMAAVYENDRAEFSIERHPYGRVNLSCLASTLKVDHSRAHDAMADCVTTAEVYRRMIKAGIF